MLKTKKIILIVCIAILILGGLATGLFFAFRTSGTTLTISESKNLINTVCKDLEWYKDTNTVTPQSSTGKSIVSPFNVEYSDYTGEVDFNGYEDFAKAFILSARFAFEEKDVSQRTFYYSEASYSYSDSPLDIELSYTGVLIFYFEIKNNILELHMLDNVLKKEAIITLEKNPTQSCKWLVKGYMNCTFQGDDNSHNYFEISKNEKDVINFSYSQIIFSEDGIDSITLENVSKIAEIQIYDCKTDLQKKLFANKSNLTDEELIIYGNNILTKMKEVENLDFKNRIMVISDFLNDSYIYLGYKEA